MERRYRLTSEQNDEIKNREGHRMQYDGPTLEPEQNLNGIELISASLPHAYLSRSNLDDACFEDADLSNADLSHTSLQNADFYAAELEDADLSFANLENACLTNANLTNTDLHGASFAKAELTGTDFTGAEITPETDFNGAFYYSLPPKGIDANRLQAMGIIEL
ncbi:MAG: pentapeptide repeat-containing protein, partial [Woeseiaceae bacterium]|nr:pentapeptide repeat-containing protein [Woeseiaceae bacterium]